MASAYMKSVVFVGMAEKMWTDYTNRDNVKGCQDMLKGVRICQGMFLREMKCPVVSPIAFDGVCPGVGVSISVICGPHKNGLTNPPFFHPLAGHSKPSNDIFSDVVAYDIDLLYEGHRFECTPICYIKRDNLVNGVR